MYLIFSEKTGAPYIDTDRQAWMFAEKPDAEDFVKENRATSPREYDLSWKAAVSECYAAGAEFIADVENGDTTIKKINRDDLERRFYNGEPNANLALYVHTKENLYLQKLKSNRFILPVKIKNIPEVSVEYPIVSARRQPYMYLAFTDLTEFEKWGKDHKEWMPLMVDFSTMKHMGKKHGFLINVYGIMFKLKPEIIEKMTLMTTEDDFR